jgi:predicted GIY-YIG superfamily endonuclease
MSLKKYSIKMILGSVLIITTQVDAVQQVYEYENKEGVVEFTDTIKENKPVIREIQIKKLTAKQKRMILASAESLE